MPADTPLLTTSGILVMTLYLVSLIVIGWAGERAHKEKTLSDFYLAGRNLGFVVLLLTLYATQYSGNTLIGFAASGYRQGFTFLSSVTFMMAIIAFYLLYAPKLQRLARERSYLTLTDYIQDRYGSRPFSILVSISGLLAMANYILSNLKAMGYAAESLTQGTISFGEGIIYLSIIIVIYESLGGLRSVAWTDVVQGLILFIGCIAIFTSVVIYFDGVAAVRDSLRAAKPQFWQPLAWDDCRLWFSTVFIVALGIALYPHAVQRIYSARDAQTLRRAFQVMVFLPLITTLPMIALGIIGAARFPDLSQKESESITLLMLAEVARGVPAAHGVVILFMAAVFAAIMSTVDSVLLTSSSMITQDFYRPLRPGASQAHLTRVGKMTSWGIMAIIIPLAIYLPQTIWRLIEIKVELLVQTAPALFLGLHLPGLRTAPVFSGFIVGTGTTLFFTVGEMITPSIPSKVWGFHAGFIGLGANLLVVLILSLLACARGQSGLEISADP